MPALQDSRIRARGQGDDNRTTYWCPELPAMKRVGHKGADLVAPGNTRESFEAALEHGVDMIEFDVLRLRDGRLVLAHDYGDASKRTPLTLDEGLDLFAAEAYAGVELDVDLKLPGYEREVVEGLRARGLSERSLDLDQYLETHRPPARARARRAPRLVGPARPARLHPQRLGGARVRRPPGDQAAPARPRRRAICARAGSTR